MTRDGELRVILEKYNISYEKSVNDNEKILARASLNDVENLLSFFKSIGVSPKSIEKCPSVLCYNVLDVKKNYNFLYSNGFPLRSLNSSLHMLSTKPDKLKETYEYLASKYGKQYIFKYASILNVNVDTIKKYENGIKPAISIDAFMSLVLRKVPLEDAKKIIDICKKYNVEITGSVLKRPPKEIEAIIQVCKKHDITITSNVFQRDAKEVDQIVEICKRYNVELTGNMFRKSPIEVERIINVCIANNVEITGVLFQRTSDEIQKIINICNIYGIKPTGTVFQNPSE